MSYNSPQVQVMSGGIAVPKRQQLSDHAVCQHCPWESNSAKNRAASTRYSKQPGHTRLERFASSCHHLDQPRTAADTIIRTCTFSSRPQFLASSQKILAEHLMTALVKLNESSTPPATMPHTHPTLTQHSPPPATCGGSGRAPFY